MPRILLVENQCFWFLNSIRNIFSQINETEFDSSYFQNAWLYFFSTISQTIAAASALLIALALIRLHVVDSSLTATERSIGQTFKIMNIYPDYINSTEHYFIHNRWSLYFDSIRELVDKYTNNFTDDSSKLHILKLIDQGSETYKRRSDLHKSLIELFKATVAIAVFSIIILPLAQWSNQILLTVGWIIGSFFIIKFLILYIDLIKRSI